MSLKDNFNQALKEILRKEGYVGDEPPKKSELDRYLDPVSDEQGNAEKRTPSAVFGGESESEAPRTAEREPEPQRDEAAASAAEQLRNSKDAYENFAKEYRNEARAARNAGYGQTAGYSAASADFTARTEREDSFDQRRGQPISPSYGTGRSDFSSGVQFNGSQGAGSVPPPNMGGYYNAPPSSGGGNGSGGSGYEAEETTVISHNTIIDGNIRSFANINIDGTVKGDVRITKNIAVSGKVVGDIECNNAIMTGSQMQGNISSKGQVQMDRDSIQLGDITANYLDLNGKIKGNVEVGGKAEFKTDAVILGNITASTITVLDGATIQGYVNTTFLQENSSNIFPESISVTE